MSREIKFRAWNKINKELESDPIIDGENGKMMAFSVLDAQFARHYRDDEVEIMQYTGLKDKNGKEIYEGDIIKGWKDSHWHDGKDRVLKEVEWIDELGGFNIIQIEMRECEVIGNIYENPELLEGTA